ncbi:MAG: peptide chain release factor N(5)-glutamine methyltransferase [Chitinophagaceae bacterium]|nr:MAG: peptide chain release factor N(5)-glutamine methyltransferase [Chitinophagaceae bacterium]
MRLAEIKQNIKKQLANSYEPVELNSLLPLFIEHITGWNQVQQVIHQNEEMVPEWEKAFQEGILQLAQGKPIQYIIGKSWFLGNDYFVNESVLIPRPETEELVEWVSEYAQIINKPLHITDIGTGSGCIAIALSLLLPDATVTGIDISENALRVAQKNATTLVANVEWVQQDILMSASLPGNYDIIVSNPPYIPLREKATMQDLVTLHEPDIALFVTNEDPLIFYKMIARLGKQALNKNGQLFFEIHYDQGPALLKLLDEMNYHAELRQDMFGKDRMIRASLKK